MVEMHRKPKLATTTTTDLPSKQQNQLRLAIPSNLSTAEILSPSPVSLNACVAYEQYLRLPELRTLWINKSFPSWKNESVIKPALQALEITFRFISVILSDPRPYSNRREWNRRLEQLAVNQIRIIADLCEDDVDRSAPVVDLSLTDGVLVRDGSLTEVWKVSGEETVVVNRISEGSLLPRLAEWRKSEEIAKRVLDSVESEMKRCWFTLGIGEVNLAGKPNLEYDVIVKPFELHRLKHTPVDCQIENFENQVLYAVHQILETWIYAAKMLVERVVEEIDAEEFEKAANDCWILERVWKLLGEIEDLNILLDPDDFLRLRSELRIEARNEAEALCFRSKGLIDVMKCSKELKHKVPRILDVEVDPKGGPRVQDAAMELYSGKGMYEKIHLMQAMQAVEVAVKKFFYGYKQMVVMVFGSLEAKAGSGEADSLTQIFMEPTYYPSLDAAKTFLGNFRSNENRRN